jgi:hypothetical protein
MLLRRTTRGTGQNLPENRNQILYWCDLKHFRENWRFGLCCAAVIGGILYLWPAMAAQLNAFSTEPILSLLRMMWYANSFVALDWRRNRFFVVLLRRSGTTGCGASSGYAAREYAQSGL